MTLQAVYHMHTTLYWLRFCPGIMLRANERLSNLNLYRLQRRAARIIAGNFDCINTRGADLMRDLGLQTLYIRKDYFLSTLMYMHKCIKGNAQMRLTNELIMTADTRPPSNFLGTSLYIKGLYCGLACHPISKMSRMLITSCASIKSSSSNDCMSVI